MSGIVVSHGNGINEQSVWGDEKYHGANDRREYSTNDEKGVADGKKSHIIGLALKFEHGVKKGIEIRFKRGASPKKDFQTRFV